MTVPIAVRLLRPFSNILLLNPTRSFNSLIDLHPKVKRSLQRGDAIVALESTIITHGMPYPHNIQTALGVEHLIADNGALAATIAIINGRIKVGLTSEEIEQLAVAAINPNTDVIKCSRRDLPYLIANKRSGGTTVAATMIIAHMVGIDIFATGGIGGVHREGHITMDVSADLIELGRTPVTVISSGIKSILDVPRTLEFLETQGVCVASYQVSNSIFPDFYTRDSGCKAPYNLDGPTEAAALINSLKELKLKSGILIGVPIPEEFAADKNLIEVAIDKAISKARNQAITGKQVTPYLLSAITSITSGQSLEANIALIRNNARTAAQIAYELVKTKKEKTSDGITHTAGSPSSSTSVPFLIGASALDLSLTMLDDIPSTLDGATYRAQPAQSPGGVARNIAEGIFKLHGSSNFLSMVGNDHLGRSLLEMMPKQIGELIAVDEELTTSLFTVVIDKKGDCKIVLGNTDIHSNITSEMILQHEDQLSSAPLIVMDANISPKSMECILQLAKKHQRPVFFEPTDMRIAHKPFALSGQLTKQIKFISPNIYELYSIIETITKRTIPFRSIDTKNITMDEIKSLLALVNDQFDCIALTLGAQGVVVSLRRDIAEAGKPLFEATTGNYLPLMQTINTKSFHSIRFYPAPKVEHIKNVSGAGDSFTSGYITALLRGYNMKKCVAFGFLAAERALQSHSAVPIRYFRDDADESVCLHNTLRNLKEIIL